MPPAGTPGGGAEEEDVLGKGSKYYKVSGSGARKPARAHSIRARVKRGGGLPAPCAPLHPVSPRPVLPPMQTLAMGPRWGW